MILELMAIFIIGLFIGYLLFGRKKRYQMVGRGYHGGAYIDRGNGNSRFLETAAGVAAGVVAGELIADAIEDVVEDGGNVINEIDEDINNAIDYVEDEVSDIADDFGDIDF
ncbi:hypothetical protein ACPB8Q_07015 [Methanocaldococcus indicus]|uniref:hypothetical protein n=1 Tax=Methanocaldococcus indicus TaxID=213231 RepID=UPI003C6CDA65